MAMYPSLSAIQQLPKVLSMVLFVFVIFVAASSQSNIQKCTSKSTGRYANCSNDSTCPTWYICNDQRQCKCGDSHNDAVICDNQNHHSAVLDCKCVTYDIQTKSTFAGSCYYNCVNNKKSVHSWLPENPQALLNGTICTYFHRAGLFCGDYEDEHSPLVLSYNISCVKCPDGHKNWWKFILVAFVPLTFFYFLYSSLTSMSHQLAFMELFGTTKHYQCLFLHD